jgi:hypothetical protein
MIWACELILPATTSPMIAPPSTEPPNSANVVSVELSPNDLETSSAVNSPTATPIPIQNEFSAAMICPAFIPNSRIQFVSVNQFEKKY